MASSSEEQIKALTGNLLDGPGMQYSGWQEFRKLSGSWKSADGRFELLLRENGTATFLARDKSALDVKLNLTGHPGSMMMALGSQPAPLTHEIEFEFHLLSSMPDTEDVPLFRPGKAWYDTDILTVTITDLLSDSQQEIPMVRQTDPPEMDLAAPIPRFCPNCGHAMEGNRICSNCGWRVGSDL